jgi:hypothetical protein
MRRVLKIGAPVLYAARSITDALWFALGGFFVAWSAVKAFFIFIPVSTGEEPASDGDANGDSLG